MGLCHFPSVMPIVFSRRIVRVTYSLVQSKISILFLASMLAFTPASAFGRHLVEPESPAAKSPSDSTDSPQGGSSSGKPQVEILIPSVTTLANAAQRSRTAALYEAVSTLIPVPKNETGEGLDFDSLLSVLSKVTSWGDTSIAIAIYTQDRDGRPRWLLRVDWPLETLVDRVRSLLNDEAGREIFKNIELKESATGAFTLEIPEMELAVLKACDGGSMIAATSEVAMPESLYGQDAVEESKRTPSKKPFLIYCSLNLDAGDKDQKGSSLFTSVAGVSAVRYVASLNRKNEWVEQFGVTWNPLVGAALKVALQKAKKPYDCPRDSYAAAVLNLGLGEGMADSLTGLPLGTIGGRADGEMLFAAVPGSGFLPVPDIFYVLRAKGRDEIIESIRKAIADDTKRRADDDLPPRWREETISGKPVFWRDPAADGVYGLTPMTFRTVIFFDGDDSADDEVGGKMETRLVIANTTTWADDAVKRWGVVSKDTFKLPASDKIHWQARLNWLRMYELAHPYLGMLAGFLEGASVPTDPGELATSLSDSDIEVRITLGGLRVKHTGPLPFGAAYVPVVAASALGATADPSSESAREKVACRNLRVLYHHALLFKHDYGRWPATVAELDGYVDFASHPELLYLRSRDRSFMEGLTSALFAGRQRGAKPGEVAVEDRDIDDSLYVIEWSESDNEWRLAFRDNEFNAYKTIYIDGRGEIHRVAKEVVQPPAADESRPDAVAVKAAGGGDAAPSDSDDTISKVQESKAEKRDKKDAEQGNEKSAESKKDKDKEADDAKESRDGEEKPKPKKRVI